MSRHSPFVIEVSDEDRRLQSLARKQTAERRMVVRARIVLAADDGEENATIADRLEVALNTVISGASASSRGAWTGSPTVNARGDPGPFPPLVMAEVKQLACELPATTGVPLARWSCAELARELVGRAVVAAISAATVWRVLHHDAIRPWFHRSWIFPHDPAFASKASTALDLYARVFEGKPLGNDEFVICADEKTSIQARCRRHPSLSPGRARLMRVEHEYDRGGSFGLPDRL